MNAWQVCRQLRYLLRAATWADGAQEKVFADRVHVSVADPDAAVGTIGFPRCYLAPGASRADEFEARLELSEVVVTIGARVTGDHVGEVAMLGGSRGNGQGSSLGRGLLEVEETVHDAVGKLAGTNGVNLRVVSRGAARVRAVEGIGYVATRELTLEAVLTTDRTYAVPTSLLATASGGGAVALTWAVPPARYDLLNVVLRRASGSTAPASATTGTGVTLSGALATSVTDTPGAGTWSYALFGGYDEINSTPTTADRYSSAATVTVVAT